MHRNRGSIAVLIAVALGALSGARVASAQTFTTLVNFDQSNGAYPWASLLQGLDGNLYGTTQLGGSTGAKGTVFSVTPSGALTTLFSFCAPDGCTDTGDQPYAGLLQTASGTFYGTAQSGAYHQGVVFTITSTGSETVLYNFCAQPNCTDGLEPSAGLVQASNGDFYGTTQFGGLNMNSLCPYADYGCGTIFKITPTGALTSLHSFCSQANCADGDEPVAGLVQGTDGNLYGTTPNGGNFEASYCSSGGCGTVFKITPSGKFATLYALCSQTNCGDGQSPGGLVQGTDGNFYGTTAAGGAGNGGTIFKITPRGAFTTLYSFCTQPGCPDGSGPRASLVQASDGNFYGTTSFGSSTACYFGCGTIFRITPAGVLTTLHIFDYKDGEEPLGSLIQDTDGMLYGTTLYGGSSDEGTLFSLDLHLARFVETLEPSGKAGATIQILGTALTGATSVTFNGTPATFRVISPSEIGTKVPSGATTGTVQVMTPLGTLSSNVAFQVLQ